MSQTIEIITVTLISDSIPYLALPAAVQRRIAASALPELFSRRLRLAAVKANDLAQSFLLFGALGSQ